VGTATRHGIQLDFAAVDAVVSAVDAGGPRCGPVVVVVVVEDRAGLVCRRVVHLLLEWQRRAAERSTAGRLKDHLVTRDDKAMVDSRLRSQYWGDMSSLSYRDQRP